MPDQPDYPWATDRDDEAAELPDVPEAAVLAMARAFYDVAPWELGKKGTIWSGLQAALAVLIEQGWKPPETEATT